MRMSPFYMEFGVECLIIWFGSYEVPLIILLLIAGGQSSLADYCTYFVAYSDGSCTDTNSARAPDRMLGEVRGSSSRSDL